MTGAIGRHTRLILRIFCFFLFWGWEIVSWLSYFSGVGVGVGKRLLYFVRVWHIEKTRVLIILRLRHQRSSVHFVWFCKLFCSEVFFLMSIYNLHNRGTACEWYAMCVLALLVFYYVIVCDASF